MNRRINKNIEIYFERFKNDIAQKAAEGADIARLLNIIQNYPVPVITPKDYEKRQRTKNIVPFTKDVKQRERMETNVLDVRERERNFVGHI